MQRGQAIVEFVVALPVLLLLLLAAHWLLSLQHLKSSLQIEAANAAWVLSRMASPDAKEDPLSQPLSAFKSQASNSTGSSYRLLGPNPTAQIAQGLSRELRTDDGGVAYRLSHSSVATHPQFKSFALTQSHVILTGAGHAVTPRLVRKRIEESDSLWGSAHRNSREVGRNITRYAAPVDAAWRRKGPDFDWLTKWQAEVPPPYTQNRLAP